MSAHQGPSRTVAVERTWRSQPTLSRWAWIPVIDGGWRTGCGGYTLTKRGAIRKGRRWHRWDVERIRRIYVSAEVFPATAKKGSSALGQEDNHESS